MKISLIAPCGMNCGICISHLRPKNKCSGCLIEAENKPNHCHKCIIKNCELLEQTESNFCFDCSKYPCTRLKQLDKRYQLNYNMSMIENLETIKKYGVVGFLESELRKWTCLCGETISVHRGFCLNCSPG